MNDAVGIDVTVHFVTFASADIDYGNLAVTLKGTDGQEITGTITGHISHPEAAYSAQRTTSVSIPTLRNATRYTVTVSGTQDPNCPQFFAAAAGQFTTRNDQTFVFQ